jgi:hypothetical protein
MKSEDSVEQQLVDLAEEEGTDPIVREVLISMAAQKMVADIMKVRP